MSLIRMMVNFSKPFEPQKTIFSCQVTELLVTLHFYHNAVMDFVHMGSAISTGENIEVDWAKFSTFS